MSNTLHHRSIGAIRLLKNLSWLKTYYAATFCDGGLLRLAILIALAVMLPKLPSNQSSHHYPFQRISGTFLAKKLAKMLIMNILANFKETLFKQCN